MGGGRIIGRLVNCIIVTLENDQKRLKKEKNYSHLDPCGSTNPQSRICTRNPICKSLFSKLDVRYEIGLVVNKHRHTHTDLHTHFRTHLGRHPRCSINRLIQRVQFHCTNPLLPIPCSCNAGMNESCGRLSVLETYHLYCRHYPTGR